MRKPTAYPTAVMRATTNTLRARSAVVRPARTAERAMGRARKRSINPLCRSSERPTAVLTAPKLTVCTKMPGMR
jgi:hypothetical protein